MQSSDNQLSHSGQLSNLNNLDDKQLDENSINKINIQSRLTGKRQFQNETKSMAVDLLKRIEQLQQKLDILESKDIQKPRKKKKIRRRARQIPRTYKCMFSNCQKQYGSQASLKNHHKIKHGIRLIRKARTSSGKIESIKGRNKNFGH